MHKVNIAISILCAIVIGSLIASIVILFRRNKYSVKFIPNSYSNGFLLWPILYNMYPSDISYDFEIKRDIVKHALKLPQNHGIIDCGAHVGDGSIPIAAALRDHGREDITVYAIEPDIRKCRLIRHLVHLNSLPNVVVVHGGLSDAAEILNGNAPAENSGATRWSASASEKAGTTFNRLDALVSDNIVSGPIGCIHLDVEGMELQAIKGAGVTIGKYKPYLSIEDHGERSTTKMLNLLPPGYSFRYRLGANSIFVHS